MRFRCGELSEKKFIKKLFVRNNCGNSGDTGFGNHKLYHRGCCHNEPQDNGKGDYRSPMRKAIDDGVEGASKKPKKKKRNTMEDMRRAYSQVKKEEAEYGEHSSLSHDWMLHCLNLSNCNCFSLKKTSN